MRRLIPIFCCLSLLACRGPVPGLLPAAEPPAVMYRSYRNYDENPAFLTNNVAAKVLWKKAIGSLMTGSGLYIAGSDVVLMNDGKIYYQKIKAINSLDAATGAVKDEFELPRETSLPFARAVDFDGSCRGQGKTFFPLIRAGASAAHLVADDRTKRMKLVGADGFCGGGYGALAADAGYRLALFARDADEAPVQWRQLKAFSGERAGGAYSGRVILITTKDDSLIVESYSLATDELQWAREIPFVAPMDDTVFEATGRKNLISFRFSKSIVISQHLACNLSTGETDDVATALDPDTGQINWKKSNIEYIITKRYDDDGLYYFIRKNEPGVLYGIDQKTGAEKLKLRLNNFDPAMGIMATRERIYYGGMDPSQRTGSLYLYNPSRLIFPKSGKFKHSTIEASKDARARAGTFSAVDRDTGAVIWTIPLNDRYALPLYDSGVLFFGNKPDFYRNLIAGSVRQYEHAVDTYTEQDVPALFPDTAFAVDAGTGKELWKLRLNGGDASSIEKILIKDRRAYIQSFSGWIYAIGWSVLR